MASTVRNTTNYSLRVGKKVIRCKDKCKYIAAKFILNNIDEISKGIAEKLNEILKSK